MPCGPTNAPTFYSATMSDFEYEWDTLFIIRVKALSYIDGEPVPITDSFEIFVGKQNIISGTKTIIDDIFLYCSNKSIILLYFEFICIIFRKYRVRFCLNKCEFLNITQITLTTTLPLTIIFLLNINLILLIIGSNQ